jgi:hypothetical protein
MKKKKPKCDCANVIGRNQVCDICQGVEESFKHLLQDTSDTDTYIRERVKGILTDFEINGDSYGVPTIEDIVDLLCEKIEGQ